MLCVGCLESRMGRQLVTGDFTASNFDPEQLNNSKYPKSGEWTTEPV